MSLLINVAIMLYLTLALIYSGREMWKGRDNN